MRSSAGFSASDRDRIARTMFLGKILVRLYAEDLCLSPLRRSGAHDDAKVSRL